MHDCCRPQILKSVESVPLDLSSTVLGKNWLLRPRPDEPVWTTHSAYKAGHDRSVPAEENFAIIEGARESRECRTLVQTHALKPGPHSDPGESCRHTDLFLSVKRAFHPHKLFPIATVVFNVQC